MYISFSVEKIEGFTNYNDNHYYVNTYCNGCSTFRKVTKEQAEKLAAKLMRLNGAKFILDENAFSRQLFTKRYSIRRHTPRA